MEGVNQLLFQRFLSKKSGFTYGELLQILMFLQYREVNAGENDIKLFVRMHTNHIIRLPVLNGRDIIQKYQHNELVNELKETGVL